VEPLSASLVPTEHDKILCTTFEATLKKKSRRIILIAYNPNQKPLFSFDGDRLWDPSPEVLDL